MKIVPWQINELLAEYEDIPLSELVEKVLGGKEFDCPQCRATGRITIDAEDPLAECPLCEGYGKTEVEYEEYCVEAGYRAKE